MSHRPLYIDERLSWRLAGSLRDRGRNAQAWKELGNGSLKDPKVIPKVIKQMGREVVFITYDNSLPEEHASLVAGEDVTLAVIAPYDEKKKAWQSYSNVAVQEAWKRDIVQRWAHRMQDQKQGSILRYALGNWGVWTPLRTKPSRGRQAGEQETVLATKKAA